MGSNKTDTVNNRALKAGVWYTVSNFVSQGITFLITPVFARMMTKTEYGDYSNFITWQSLLLILTTLELYSTVNLARLEFKDQVKEYLSTIAVLGSAFTLCCYLLVMVFQDKFTVLFGMDMKYIHIMFCYLMFAPALEITKVVNRAFMKYKFATVLTLSSSIFSVGVSLLLSVVMVDKLWGRVVGYEIILILLNLSLFVYIVYRGRCFKWTFAKYALGLAIPYIPHLLSLNILYSSDRIMIKWFCGAEDTASYSMAYTCAMIISLLMTSVNQAMSPWLYDKLHIEHYREIKKITKIYIGGFCVCVLGVIMIAPEILWVFGGAKYLNVKFIIPPIMAGACLQFLYTNYVNIELYYKKRLMVSLGTMAAALLNIPLNYIFIRMFGYIAGAYTTLFCYAMLLLFHYLNVRRIKKTEIYDNRYIFLCGALMVVLGISCVMLYSVNWLRYILIALYAVAWIVVICKNWNFIREKLKK